MASEPTPAPASPAAASAPAAAAPAVPHPNREPSREHPTITAEDAPSAAPIELDDPPKSAAGEEDPGAANDMAADDGHPPTAAPRTAPAGGSRP